MTTKQITHEEEKEWEFLDFALSLKKEWERKQPRLSDRQLLKIYPEGKDIIKAKIQEWEDRSREICDSIRRKLVVMKQYNSEENVIEFYRYWLKITDGKELYEAERHLMRLKRLLFATKNQLPKGHISEHAKQQSLATPIESLIEQDLRKSGKNLTCLCPLHKEKNPSFFIYPETNNFWCFGCNQGGDVITFVRLLHGYTFKEAVHYLLNK